MIFEDRIELLKQKDAACRLEYQELLTFDVDLLTINCLSEAMKYIDKAFALVPEDEQLIILYRKAELFGKNYSKALPYILKYYERNPIDRYNLAFLCPPTGPLITIRITAGITTNCRCWEDQSDNRVQLIFLQLNRICRSYELNAVTFFSGCIYLNNRHEIKFGTEIISSF